LIIQEHKNGIRTYHFNNLTRSEIFHAIFTRQGGVSQFPYESLNFGGTVGDKPTHVLENHKRAFMAINKPLESRFDVWQVHGKDIIITEHPRTDSEKHQKADGIITARPGITLMMRFADCVPVMVADPVKKIVGIYHAGWQGTHLKIGAEFINTMKSMFHSNVENLIAGIGPSICTDCYQVGEDLKLKFRDAFGKKGDRFLKVFNGSYHLDLWMANRLILEECGLQNIEVAGICTAHNKSEWYSHRGEFGKTGRFGAIISL
jgi:YfiH family protein